MRKTITTIIILLLASYTASAQIYRAGGIGGFGTNTSYGSGSGGGIRGSHSGSGNQWFINAGAVYNALSDNDFDVLQEFGGIGGILEVGKGSQSLAIEYITHTLDIPGINIDATDPNANITSTDYNQLRVYVKRRQYFMDFLYLHGGTGINRLSIESETASVQGLPTTTVSASNTYFLINMGLGLDINLGGFGFFIESGVASTQGGNLTTKNNVQFDGIRGGIKVLF